jgi:hypothetical protein
MRKKKILKKPPLLLLSMRNLKRRFHLQKKKSLKKVRKGRIFQGLRVDLLLLTVLKLIWLKRWFSMTYHQFIQRM